MALILLILLISIYCYLLGSIPTAVWYGRRFYGVDIRTLGSGNAGATNTFRVFGKKAGSIVLLIDAWKGHFATAQAVILYKIGLVNLETCITLQVIFGFLAVLGHLLPAFNHFKGGKGVATLLGMVICLHPLAAFLSILFFVITFVIFHFVSLASIVGSFTFPILLLFETFGKEYPLMIIFGFFVTSLVLFTHRKNISRILKGTENRMYFIPKKR